MHGRLPDRLHARLQRYRDLQHELFQRLRRQLRGSQLRPHVSPGLHLQRDVLVKRVAIALSVAVLCVGAPAFAQNKSAAKEAYNRGLEAHKKGDHQKAAEEFARADALAPSPVALQAAIDAAVDADDPVLGAELLERSTREPPGDALKASIDTARSKLGGRAGRVRIVCPSKCRATIDNVPVDTAKPAWAKIGPHVVTIDVESAGETLTKVSVVADQVVEVRPNPPAAPPPPAPVPAPVVAPPPAPALTTQDVAPPAPSSGGLSPVVFFVLAGGTLVLGGASAVLAIDTKNKHGEFEDAGCARANATPCAELKDDGEERQLATNVLLLTTGALAITTAVVGIAFTRWKGPTIAPTTGGAIVGWTSAF